MPDAAAVARRAIAVLDLTALGDAETEATTAELCARAQTPVGPVAAVCLWPRWVAVARSRLPPGIELATVINFPAGAAPQAQVLHEARQAVLDGATELDLVFPYAAFAAGDPDGPPALVAAVRRAEPLVRLKVILETGRLTPAQIDQAAHLAITAGADFLKTSTGKVQPPATLEATTQLLRAAQAAPRPVGVKPAGGIRTLGDAAAFLALADHEMGPHWVSPRTFRLGASALLDALLAELGHGPASAGTTPY